MPVLFLVYGVSRLGGRCIIVVSPYVRRSSLRRRVVVSLLFLSWHCAALRLPTCPIVGVRSARLVFEVWRATIGGSCVVGAGFYAPRGFLRGALPLVFFFFLSIVLY